MFAWDDLRVFLAIARGGSLAAAARTLGVNHSTVFRRLNAFEAAVGVRLFDRQPEGYAVTAEGAEMLVRAARIEDEVLALDRELSGRDLRLEGTVRVTTPDTVALGLLPPHLARLRRAQPGIEIELAVSNQIYNLSKREADVAIRPAKAPEGAMVGRRLAGIAFAAYGARSYLGTAAAPKSPEELAAHPRVGPDESLADTAAARWLRTHAPDAAVACRCDSLMAQVHAVRAGVGLGLLPCFLADPDPALVRLPLPAPEMETGLWLLTHEDLRRTARIRAVLDFLAEALGGERDRLEGR